MAGSWAGRLQHGVPGPLWAPVCGHSGLLLKEARLLYTQWPSFLQAYVSEPSSVTLIATWWQKPQSARQRGFLSALRPPPTSERAAFCSGGISCSSPPHAQAGGWVQTCPPLLRTGLCWLAQRGAESLLCRRCGDGSGCGPLLLPDFSEYFRFLCSLDRVYFKPWLGS